MMCTRAKTWLCVAATVLLCWLPAGSAYEKGHEKDYEKIFRPDLGVHAGGASPRSIRSSVSSFENEPEPSMDSDEPLPASPSPTPSMSPSPSATPVPSPLPSPSPTATPSPSTAFESPTPTRTPTPSMAPPEVRFAMYKKPGSEEVAAIRAASDSVSGRKETDGFHGDASRNATEMHERSSAITEDRGEPSELLADPSDEGDYERPVAASSAAKLDDNTLTQKHMRSAEDVRDPRQNKSFVARMSSGVETDNSLLLRHSIEYGTENPSYENENHAAAGPVSEADYMDDSSVKSPSFESLNDAGIANHKDDDAEYYVSHGFENGATFKPPLELSSDSQHIEDLLYELITSHKLRSMIDVPCRSHLSWMPSLLGRVAKKEPNFLYTCVDSSRVILRYAVGNVGKTGVQSRFVMSKFWEEPLPQADVIFSWGGIERMQPRNVGLFLTNLAKYRRHRYLILRLLDSEDTSGTRRL